MPRIGSAAVDSHGDPLASSQIAFPGTASAAIAASTGTGILWMLAALPFRLPGFPRAHPAEILSGDGNRFRALFCSHGFGDHFPCLVRSAAYDLASAGLVNAAVDASPWHDFVRHAGAQDHAARRFFRHCVGGACSCRRAFGLHLSPGLWASVFVGLIGVWVIIGRTAMDFSPSTLFPFLAALANALIRSRPGFFTVPMHQSQPSFTRRWPEFCFVADFCPLPPPRQTLSMAV
jgi:hypothetical protein